MQSLKSNWRGAPLKVAQRFENLLTETELRTTLVGEMCYLELRTEEIATVLRMSDDEWKREKIFSVSKVYVNWRYKIYFYL